MKKILVIGAGKSSTVLISYLANHAEEFNLQVTVADADIVLAQQKIDAAGNMVAAELDVTDESAREKLINWADVVISLLPPSLHILAAQSCYKLNRHLLTASYVDPAIAALDEGLKEKGLIFLCEMGLDPGIDHMSAMELIHRIEQKGGEIYSFKSHCGGLVAAESDDNPWHYKISWNPRNVVTAGGAGARYRQLNREVSLNQREVFAHAGGLSVDTEAFAFYPNRDSLSYISLYGLEACSDFLRTTLRHPDFIAGWQAVLAAELTDETFLYDTRGLTAADFFKIHFARTGMPDALRISGEPTPTLILRQFEFLGLHDDITVINKGKCTAAAVLQFLLENKLMLKPADRDRVIMRHDIKYMLNGAHYECDSTLDLDGVDSSQTAMAATVGMPLALAAIMIANGQIKLRGVQIPVVPEIYVPVLQQLEQEGIVFQEHTRKI